VSDIDLCRDLILWCDAVQAEIIQNPASFVELDPEMAYTLLDLKRAVSRLYACTSQDMRRALSAGALPRLRVVSLCERVPLFLNTLLSVQVLCQQKVYACRASCCC
jgi:hypothetical protein